MSTWSAPGHAAALATLAARLAQTPWPGPPPGLTPLAPARPMRSVLAGTWEGGTGPVPVVVKWHRPLSALDRVGLLLRGGRGPREARVLRALAREGLRVPEVLAATDQGCDLLVTRRIADLAPLPAAQQAAPALVRAVAALLAQAQRVGLVHRDLTRANVGLTPQGPVLVDLGGAHLGAGGLQRAALAHLAQAAHGLLHGATRTQRVRALHAWLDAHGEGAQAWRHWIRPLERALERRRRLHRRRRERRIARPGRHFEAFEVGGIAGVRRTPEAPGSWIAQVPAWLATTPPHAAPAHATPLKPPAVLGLALGDGRRVVLKRYAAAGRGRESRARRAFARAVGLEERGVPVAPALLAAWGPGSASALVSEWLDLPDLDLVLRRDGRYFAWPRARRVALLEGLGRAVRALHDVEASHRDLKSPNLLVSEGPEGVTFPIADVDGVRLRYRAVGWRRRIRDLARLAASLPLSAADRLRVLAAYARVPPRPPLALRDLALRVHRGAQAHRARLAAGAGAAPRGHPGP